MYQFNKEVSLKEYQDLDKKVTVGFVNECIAKLFQEKIPNALFNITVYTNKCEECGNISIMVEITTDEKEVYNKPQFKINMLQLTNIGYCEKHKK